MVDRWWLIHQGALFGIKGYVALDRYPGPGCNTLLLRLIQEIFIVHVPLTVPHDGLLHSRVALLNSYPNANQRGNKYHIYNGLWYDPSWTRTHDLPHERGTRQPLSHPDVTGAWTHDLPHERGTRQPLSHPDTFILDRMHWQAVRHSRVNDNWNTTVMLPIDRNVKSAHYPPQKDWFINMEPP